MDSSVTCPRWLKTGGEIKLEGFLRQDIYIDKNSFTKYKTFISYFWAREHLKNDALLEKNSRVQWLEGEVGKGRALTRKGEGRLMPKVLM